MTALLIAGTACAADPATVEQRVQRLQVALLLPVLVRGETPALLSLAEKD